MSNQKNSAWDAFWLALMTIELGTTAATTIMMRNWHWMLKWPNIDRRLNDEGNRMVTEKIAAAMEVVSAWQRVTLGAWPGVFNPWRSGQILLTPLHRKTTANARRLMRRKNF